MLGIVVLLLFGALFRRRGNTWPKTIFKTAGVYVVYLTLFYGGMFGAMGLRDSLTTPPEPVTQRLVGSDFLPPAIIPTATAEPVTYAPLTPASMTSLDIDADPTVARTIMATVPRYPDRSGCAPAYPEERTCIPPGPPYNQGCGITTERMFRVLRADPQGLDHDGDGIGCEPIPGALVAPAAPANPAPAAPQPAGDCDPSYPDVCILPVWAAGDLDCRDVPYGNFRVVGGDPHRFDGPYDGSNPYEPDGLGCEWN